MNEIMTSKDVAEYLGVSVNTVNVWRKSDRGPKFFQRGYGRFFYKQDDVISFAKEHGYKNDQ